MISIDKTIIQQIQDYRHLPEALAIFYAPAMITIYN